MQKGELFVIGKDKAVIHLLGHPSEVRVHFVKEHNVVPCNPHHADELEYEVHRSSHSRSGFVLIISWSVSGLREIKWEADY